MRRLLLGFCCAILLTGISARAATAQLTRSDTAAVLVHTAQRLQDEGERDLAADLLRFVIQWYGDTPVAEQAASLLNAMDRARVAGSGTTQFIVTNTLVGAWLGIVIPAALGADDSPPYGAGLLFGPSTGLVGSLLYTKTHPITSGQARAYGLSFQWGAWQALGWRDVLDIGDREECFLDGLGGEVCFEDTPGEAPWRATLLGGVAGLVTGGVLAGLDIPGGDAALVNDASLWGTWFGLVGGVLADAEDDALLTWALLGGNALLVSGIPLARALRPSVSQVRFVSIVGIAGGLAGLGIDLIGEIDDEKAAIAIPAIGSAIGLAIGTVATVGKARSGTSSASAPGAAALLNVGGGAGLGAPLPVPVSYPTMLRDGRIGRRPGIGVRLVNVRF
jgi:hypothetical protein